MCLHGMSNALRCCNLRWHSIEHVRFWLNQLMDFVRCHLILYHDLFPQNSNAHSGISLTSSDRNSRRHLDCHDIYLFKNSCICWRSRFAFRITYLDWEFFDIYLRRNEFCSFMCTGSIIVHVKRKNKYVKKSVLVATCDVIVALHIHSEMWFYPHRELSKWM